MREKGGRQNEILVFHVISSLEYMDTRGSIVFTVFGAASLHHILSGCKIILSSRRFTWMHNQKSKCFTSAIEGKCKDINAAKPKKQEMEFVCEGGESCRTLVPCGKAS